MAKVIVKKKDEALGTLGEVRGYARKALTTSKSWSGRVKVSRRAARSASTKSSMPPTTSLTKSVKK